MRGADYNLTNSKEFGVETSPHAWSRFKYCQMCHIFLGNISTCVEQIGRHRLEAEEVGKHLHMRGADSDI